MKNKLFSYQQLSREHSGQNHNNINSAVFKHPNVNKSLQNPLQSNIKQLKKTSTKPNLYQYFPDLKKSFTNSTNIRNFSKESKSSVQAENNDLMNTLQTNEGTVRTKLNFYCRLW
jgi:hypothetical protein